MKVKTTEALVGKVLFWNFNASQWENEMTDAEDFLFESFARKDEIDKFNETVKSSGGVIGTIIEDDPETLDGEEYSLFLIPGAHWANRFAYFIYKFADGVTEDPLLEKDTCYVW